MQSALVDSGPLIALFDRDDKYHRRVRGFLKTHSLRLVTTWPVLTEVCALLPRPAVADFLEFVSRGGVGVEDMTTADVPAMLDLLRKYADRPMDLADASLVVLATRTGRDAILSLDSDFWIYQMPGKRAFRNLLFSLRR